MSEQKRGQGTQGDTKIPYTAREEVQGKSIGISGPRPSPVSPPTWEHRLKQAEESGELDELVNDVYQGRERLGFIPRDTAEDEAEHQLWIRWLMERQL